MNILVIVLAGLLPTYLLRFSIAGIPTNAFEVAVWVVCISSFCSAKMRRQLVDAIRAIPKKYLLWMFLFLLAAILSTLHSPDVRSSLGILKGWVITPMVFGLLVSAARRGSQVEGEDDVSRQIVHSLVLSGLVVALLGVSQIHGLNRITSIYDVPNSLALFLVPICVIAAWVGIREKNRYYQLVSLCILIAIVFTQSFGALVAIVGTMMIGWRVFSPSYEGEPLPVAGVGVSVRDATPPRLPSHEGRKYTAYLLLIFLILTTSIFLFSGRFEYLIRPLINPNATNSATVRLQLWDVGISLIQKNPIFGIGLGQFEPAYQTELHRRFEQQANEANAATTYPPIRRTRLWRATYNLQPEFVFRDPHNWIISFWLNTGLLGLCSFTALNIAALSFRNPGDITVRNRYSDAIALALISMLIFGLFDTIYWKNDLSALWWMLIFLLI